MNISAFACGSDVFVNFEYIKGYTFKYAHFWVNSARLAVLCHLMTGLFAVCGITMPIFSKLNDRFECLLPHDISTCT